MKGVDAALVAGLAPIEGECHVIAAAPMRIHNPFLCVPASVGNPSRPTATDSADASRSLDQVVLGAQPNAAAPASPAVVPSTALRLGMAVALGLTAWGAVTPALAAAPPPAAVSISQSATATQGSPSKAVPGAQTASYQEVAPAVKLSRHMRNVKREIDASIAQPQRFANVIEGFGQGREGNCSAVAVIKASMQHYGTGALGKVVATPQGYQVTTRTGVTYAISFEELELADELEHFASWDARVSAYATLCYATMAKSAALYELDNAHSYKEALQALAKPQYVLTDARMLGVANDLKPVPVNRQGYPGYDAVIGASEKHAVLIVEKKPGSGRYITDHYGAAYDYTGTDTNRRPLVRAWGYVAEGTHEMAGD